METFRKNVIIDKLKSSNHNYKWHLNWLKEIKRRDKKRTANLLRVKSPVVSVSKKEVPKKRGFWERIICFFRKLFH